MSNATETRVIPILLLSEGGLVKSRRFKEHKYVGDPLNAVRIFNDKEVDEIVLLDIGATESGRRPNYELIEEIAGECFMPMAYGGGVRSVEEIQRLLKLGVEKVVINSAAAENQGLIRQASLEVGSQSIVGSIDVKKNLWGRYGVFTHGGRKDVGLDPVELARRYESEGAGEIVINSINNDGTMKGYDLDLVRSVSGAVGVPVVACGGAGLLSHFAEALGAGASAVAGGSIFVFYGKHRAVLISYPTRTELASVFQKGIHE